MPQQFLPAMAVALARKKGFSVNEEQAKKEAGFAVATDNAVLEPIAWVRPSAEGSNTLGYTLMGMAAAGYPAEQLTDAHIHYFSIHQSRDGAWRNSSYRPPEEYSALTTTAVRLACDKTLSVARPARGVCRASHSREEMAALGEDLFDRGTIDAAERARRCRRQPGGARAVREGIESDSESRWKLEPASRYSRLRRMPLAKRFTHCMSPEKRRSAIRSTRKASSGCCAINCRTGLGSLPHGRAGSAPYIRKLPAWLASICVPSGFELGGIEPAAYVA